MKKFLLLIGLIFLTVNASFAAKIPDDVKSYIESRVPQADIRFDGVITFPDNTVYLPLFPSLFSDIKTLKIKQTFPENKDLKDRPNIIIFNNDFVLMKVLSDGAGHRTVLHQSNPPLQVRTGLLPQDMLVPSGLIIPENIKSIAGNLKIDTKNEDIIKVENQNSFEDFLTKGETSTASLISQLKNKILYVTTNYSKNIQVVEPAKSAPSYSLAQKSIPIDVKAVKNGKFLLVTTYDRPFLDIVSVADSRFIKQISLGTNPEEIIVDNSTDRAYITSPEASTIYVLDLNTMSLIQKIKVNGYCEHVILNENKIAYVDKLQNEIWVIDINKNYELRDIGRFPNVSALVFKNNKLYLASRTKSRLAVIDYSTLGLLHEFTTVSKPIKMLVNGNDLYILGAESNRIDIIDTTNDTYKSSINVYKEGFSASLNRIDDTNLVIVTNLKTNQYAIVDLNSNKVIKVYDLNVPIKNVIITDKVKLYE